MALCLSVCEFDVCGTKNYVFVVLRSNECDTNFTFCGNKHYMSLCNRLNKASTVHDVVYFTLDCANWFIQPTDFGSLTGFFLCLCQLSKVLVC